MNILKAHIKEVYCSGFTNDKRFIIYNPFSPCFSTEGAEHSLEQMHCRFAKQQYVDISRRSNSDLCLDDIESLLTEGGLFQT